MTLLWCSFSGTNRIRLSILNRSQFRSNCKFSLSIFFCLCFQRSIFFRCSQASCVSEETSCRNVSCVRSRKLGLCFSNYSCEYVLSLPLPFAYRKRICCMISGGKIDFFSLNFWRERNGTKTLEFSLCSIIATHRFFHPRVSKTHRLEKKSFQTQVRHLSSSLSLSLYLTLSLPAVPISQFICLNRKHSFSEENMSVIQLNVLLSVRLRTHLVGSRRFELYATITSRNPINNTLTYKQRVFFIQSKKKKMAFAHDDFYP